jgi:CHAT domain-containing protein
MITNKLLIHLLLLIIVGITPVRANNSATLLQQGQDNLTLGHYREAAQQLAQAEQQANSDELILIHALQGYMALQQQQINLAEQKLTIALTQARQQNNEDLVSRIHLYLGQLYEHKQDSEQALYHIQQAVAHPEKMQDKALLVSSYYQLANIAINDHRPQQAWEKLQQAVSLMTALPANPSNSQLWLNIGYQTLQLYQLSPQENYLQAAFKYLNQALNQAEIDQQPRVQVSALKHLASMYKHQQRTDEAIKLLLDAIGIAQKEDANDLLIDLEWQVGQLYQQQNNNAQAISAYRLAVRHIDNIRIDIPVSYQNGRSSFRDTFAPIYLSLADLLLRQAETASLEQQQVLLAEARDSIERMKKSELEDYFQSRCDISATPINLQKTDPHAAALYPIALPDRLELIIYTADGLRRFSSPVTAKELDLRARQFAGHLREYAGFSKSKPYAQLLHHWMIEPVEAYLQQQHIETLIYIPDGALRLVPLAALYDGKKFVIENYAVVTSPGMSLIDSGSFQRQKQMLLAGMSVPGDVVSDLPTNLLSNLVTESPEIRGLARELKQMELTGQKRELTASEQQEKNRQLHDLLRNPMVIEKLQQQLSLPGVAVEIRRLAEQNQTDYLLNDSFTLENFKQLLQEKPHDILHIASHGFFGSTSENSFIMTYDKVLNLDQLEILLSADYFKQHPIDLLTLSACQTAQGDDRSPLGISGVAIKTKVHSALGSLWPVSDDATAELMSSFYHSLTQPNQSKAKALQAAMLNVLRKEKFSNPAYWSPFILIGSWT